LNNAEHVSTHITNARTRLAVIEGLLQYQQIQGAEWLAGKAPSHADAVVFGWYAQNRLNPELVKQIWKHESLPLVAAWVKRVEGLVRAEELS
jgi:glutathione S-transferase